MYAQGADTIRWNPMRPQPLYRAVLRRLVSWSALVVFVVFGLSKAVHGGTAPGYSTVTVGAGETLWAIAAERYPTDDARTKIDEIMRVNHLQQPLVYPGEKLRVPNE